MSSGDFSEDVLLSSGDFSKDVLLSSGDFSGDVLLSDGDFWVDFSDESLEESLLSLDPSVLSFSSVFPFPDLPLK